MESRDNYFIGVTLPEELKTVIDGARGWMQKKWGNRSGMKTECHITLVPPFSCDKTLSEMKKILDGVTVPQVDVSVRGGVPSEGGQSMRTLNTAVLSNY